MDRAKIIFSTLHKLVPTWGFDYFLTLTVIFCFFLCQIFTYMIFRRLFDDWRWFLEITFVIKESLYTWSFSLLTLIPNQLWYHLVLPYPFFCKLDTNIRSRNKTMYIYFFPSLYEYTKFIVPICRPCQTHFFLFNSRSPSNKDTTIILFLSACLP